MCNRWIAILLLVSMVCLLIFSASAAYSRFTLVLDDIKNPVFEAKSIRIQFNNGFLGVGRLEIDIAEINVQNYVLKNISLLCNTFQYNQKEILCKGGRVNIPGLFSSPVSLQFLFDSSFLRIGLSPAKNESWQFTLQQDKTAWKGLLTINNGKLKAIAGLLSDNEQLPKPNGGEINGTIQFEGVESNLKAASIDLSIAAFAFADHAGLHAGEGIELMLKSDLEYSSLHDHWRWQSDLYWSAGEVFWQPVYLTGNGHHLRVHGIVDNETVRLLDSSLMLTGVGGFDFSGILNKSDNQLSTFQLKSEHIELSALFDHILKPFLRNTSFAEMEVDGSADFTFKLKKGVFSSLQIDLNDVSIIDSRDRFAFHRIDAHIPWRFDRTTVADINMMNGHLLHIPLGAVRVPLEINKFNLFLPQLALPVLDGVLSLEDFSAAYTDKGWQWKFNSKLAPVTMAALTEALQIPQMHGTLSAFIPEVRYDGSNVLVNGVLQLNVFGGSVVIHNLKLIEPMGLAPHLKADIAMRDLELELLTRTFSFGKMEGRVDVDVGQLELTNWKPIHFNARLFSSPGDYSRRISQAAIENISALGGEGAVVAIQRSFLRFFEEFRYSEIGWQCALRFNICYMGGIESEPQSRYTLVKGGGIPAITVRGYNREVGWQELIDRLRRITQENDPVIQ
ncbi:MAG: hypothetical protein H6937_03020 [Burkholderiales bacterium]|nr:hypothetical protein [Burkholderiales bacterium]MDR4516726.1 hypothetical protein [Nitrosomonas sp.]